ncbi:PREDICTED: F-box/LRR-repeat protein At4g14103 [Theobroma cacao]|uniref:F-box/LRR-repeat protein At4g14103 n=1 Tax=Theobroma cacao TaxID=3641 RepID=A0AB32W4B2_THECC|nr:PREDICTED: F-box/LRR-repeat protein At4g14103 [Theobroma cacao]XP_017974793.1 PREDICTED: F-box/LRR-repeat protein At4g14103 [Theobroma cacao]XP_017974794.1 PREDICTED: F-box/LRR-repeat protein At4g14103 [Theobroma cacao]
MDTGTLKVMRKEEEDVISKLPEKVLGHILSHLPTIEAVQTSVLATKWRYLWTHIDNLDFDADDFLGDRNFFMDFVDRVLRLRHTNDIEKFSLRFYDLKSDLHRVNDWIRYAMSCNVKEIELLLLSSDEEGIPVRLPDNFSSCDSLVALNLGNDFVFDIPPTNKCFPSLKVLHVDVTSPDDEFLNKLLCSCPVLEDFSICGDFQYGGDYDYAFKISIPTLKKLKIKLIYDDFKDELDNEFIIETPKLEYLSIQDPSIAFFVIDEIPSLIEARVGIGHTNYVRDNLISEYRALRVMEVLKGVRNAKSLTLRENTIATLSSAFNDADDFPTFLHLMHLQLGIDYCFGWKLLPHFLKISPILKSLVLEKEYPMDEEDEIEREANFGWISPRFAPYCLSQHLKEIKMKNLWGSEDEVDVVKYLLENSKVLEKMCIKFDPGKEIVKEELDENMIKKFPRSSEKCKIEFV